MKNETKQKIVPCLWLDNNGEEAMQFYLSVFPDSKAGDILRYMEGSHLPAGTLLTGQFWLYGQEFTVLNGGPMFRINPSISFFVTCTSDEEIETLWKKLSEGGEALMPLGEYAWSKKYGWVKDKFGATWQLMMGQLSEGRPKITPSFLFSDKQYGNAKPAMEFYTSVFPESKITSMQLFEADEPQPEGKVKFANFTLSGQSFAAMEGPGGQLFNEAVSLIINCYTQEEVDFYWNTLSKNGGEESMCGWLKDKFGVSWQVAPVPVIAMFMDPDVQKANRAMQAMMKMRKIDIATVEAAFNG